MEFHGLASVAIRHRRMNAALGAMLLLLPLSANAQGTLEDYRRAATINQRFANLTTGLVPAESWIGQTNQAVYRVTVPGGARFVRVDAAQWTKQPAFDHAAVAKSLSTAAGQQYTEITLPFMSISVVENGAAFEGDAARFALSLRDRDLVVLACRRSSDGRRWPRRARWCGRWTRARGADTTRCAGQSRRASGRSWTEVFSPDCRTVAFVQNYNIAIRPAPPPASPGSRVAGVVVAARRRPRCYTQRTTRY